MSAGKYYIDTRKLEYWQKDYLNDIFNINYSWNYNIISNINLENRFKSVNVCDGLSYIQVNYGTKIKEITYTELIQLLNKTKIYECWI